MTTLNLAPKFRRVKYIDGFAIILWSLLALTIDAFGHADESTEPVPVKFYGNMCAKGGYTITLHGETVVGGGALCAYAKSGVGEVGIPIGQPTIVEARGQLLEDGTNTICTTHIYFQVSGCYMLYAKIDGTWQHTSVINAGEGGGEWEVILLQNPLPPGKAEPVLGSVHFPISLGAGLSSYSAGELLLAAENINATTATRLSMALVPSILAGGDLQTVTDTGGLRQVFDGVNLIDLSDVAGGGYDVRFFPPGDFYAALQDGLYPIFGTAAPFVTYRFRDRTDMEGPKLLVEELRPGAPARYCLFIQRPGAVWVMEQGAYAGSEFSPLRRTTRSETNVAGQPVHVLSEEDFTLGATPQTTVRREFTGAASAPYTNKRQSIDEPGGRRLTYDYIRGDFDRASHVFVANPAGAYLSTSETLGRKTGEPELVAGRSTRTTTITDAENRSHQEKFSVFDGSDFAVISTTNFEYDSEDNLTARTVNGRVEYSAYWLGGLKQWETDSTGVRTDYTYWPDTYGSAYVFDPPVYTETRAALPAVGSLPSISGLTSRYWYMTTGEGVRYPYWTERYGGEHYTDSYQYLDDEGRVTYADESELQSQTSYETLPDGFTRATTTFPSGGASIRVTDVEDRLISVDGSAVTPEYHTYTTDELGNPVHTVYYGSATAATPNYRSETSDALGRTIKEVRPAYLTDTTAGLNIKTYHYSPTTGQLLRETATDLADRLYVYDDFGDLWRSGLDIDNDGELRLDSSDRVDETTVVYEQEGADWYRVTTRRSAMAVDDSTLTPTNTTRELLTLPADTLSDVSSIVGGITLSREVVTVDRSSALVTTTISRSGVAQPELIVSRAGLIQTEQASYQTVPVRYTYDGLGRRDTITDPGQGVVTDYDYAPAGDHLLQVSRRSADETLSLVTSFTYRGQGESGAGQIASRTINGQTTYFAYDLGGREARTWGASYPVRREYDIFGRLEKLHTYRSVAGIDFATSDWAGGTPDTTTWNYHPATGQLIAKTDAAAHSVRYGYYLSGLPHTRSAARTVSVPAPDSPLVTTYSYTEAGEIQTIDYSDTTPDVAIAYHRDGRIDNIGDSAGLLTLTYDPVHFQITREEYTGGGLLSGRGLVRGYDSSLRPQVLATDSGQGLSYGYDTAGRLETVAQRFHSAVISYAPETNRVQRTLIKRVGVERLRYERAFDALGRLDTVTTSAGGATRVFRDYRYDLANRRDAVALEDTRRWAFGYDDLGQVQSAQKRLADDTTVLAGYDFGYAFDLTGNRTGTSVNGRAAVYTPDMLNQYDQRTVPGAIDVRGEAQADAVVTVGGQTTLREDRDFYREVVVGNNAGAANPPIVVGVAVSGPPAESASDTRSAFLPGTPEIFIHDADGNLTHDGRWDYSWDAENRLVSMETRGEVAAAFPTLKQRLEFVYDARGRRIGKTVRRSWNGVTYADVSETRFLYDGWNLIEETDHSTPADPRLVRSYVWGLDLSESPQGAGGVGGLLWADTPTHTFAASADAGGNVVAWINTATLAVAGRADYGPFGEVVQQTGVARELPFGFSTKYTDAETGLLYYGFRYYNPSTGRWPSRDPIGQEGGVNLFALVYNNPINFWDGLGLQAENAPSFVPDGDFAFNELIAHYFNGLGLGFYRDNDWWGSYMKSGSRHFRGAARDRLIATIQSSGLRPVDRLRSVQGKTTFSEQIFDSSTTGKRTGYYLMNGPNPYVLVQYELMVGDDCNLRGKIKYGFFDKMDKNLNPFVYPWATVVADAVHGAYSALVTLGNASDFDLIVSWESEIFIKRKNLLQFDTSSPGKSSGWPFDEK